MIPASKAAVTPRAKRKLVEQVVVVHDGAVSRVFTEISWRRGPAGGRDAKKWGFDGAEVPGHELMSVIVDGWDYQQSPVYSSDLY